MHFVSIFFYSFSRFLYITFPIPDLDPYYKSSPGDYLAHLIGHEGKGSLLSVLKNLRWANSLVGGQKEGSKGFGFFVVNIDLTETGLEHVDEIVLLVFQYLQMLRTKDGIQVCNKSLLIGSLINVFIGCLHSLAFKNSINLLGYLLILTKIPEYPRKLVLCVVPAQQISYFL